MKLMPTCIPCILDDVIVAVNLIIQNETIQKKITTQFIHEFSDLDYNKIPSFYITQFHRLIKKETGLKVPFSEKRKICNQIGSRIAKKVGAKATSLIDYTRFEFLVKWAIAGNKLDFRTAGEGYSFNDEFIEQMLQESIDSGLSINDLPRLWDFIQTTPTILYVLDNVGEIAFDKLLLSHLKQLGCYVIAVLRGGAITSDATLEDGMELGINEVVDEIIVGCPDTLGISFDEATENFWKALEKTQLVISKGQANYYAFSEVEKTAHYKIAYLLTTKCNLVSNKFGKKGKVNIAKFV